MVFKKKTEEKPKETNLSVKKEDKDKTTNSIPEIDKILKENPVLETNIKEVHDVLSHLSNLGKKDNSKSNNLNLGGVFKRWVVVMKNNKYVSDFGVIEKTYNGVKLLIKMENIQGVNKVVFAQLYPESSFSIENIKSNKSKIKSDYNRLKQIETILEKNIYEGLNKFYKFNLKDTRLLLNKKEIELESIRHGSTFNYDFGIRKDNIPVLIYNLKNDSLYLQKGVSETNIITEATEIKKIGSLSSLRDINKQLPKNHRKDWIKIMLNILFFLFFMGNVFSFFWFISYNEERSFEQCKERLDDIFDTSAVGFQKLYSEIPKTDNKILEELLKQNKVFIDLIANREEIETDKFGRPSNK